MILALLLAALPEASPLAIDVQVAPEEVTLGEHVTVTIAVDHDARDVYSLPSFDAAPMAIPQGMPGIGVHREEISGHALTTFVLTLVDYGTVEPKIPDLTLHVTGPDGERVLNLRGRPLKFRSLVKEEGDQSPDRAHHGPKSPVPVMVRSYLWLWILLGLAAIAAAVYFLRRKKAVAPEVKVAPRVEFDDLALQLLSSLGADAPWKRGEGRFAIFRLSEIVRGYLGSRLDFNALDMTSEEFLEVLHQRRLMGLDLAELEEEVRWEDLVKFAKLEPTAEECLRGIKRAELLIRHTRPLRAIPREAA